MGFLAEYIGQVYENLDDLVFSFLVVLITVFICNLAREMLLYEGRLNLDLDYRFAASELIGTVEAFVICFEINYIIYDVFGLFMYVLASFIWFVWQSKRTPEHQCEANILHLLVNHVKALGYRRDGANTDDELKMTLYQRFDFLGLMVCAELVGVYIAFNFVLYGALKHASYWTMWRASNYHFTRYNSVNDWQSSISVGPVSAGLSETIFSCAQYLWPAYLEFRKLDGNAFVVMTSIGKAIFAGVGAGYSGGFYNPLMALELERHTQGPSSLILCLVYLVGPFIGTIFGLLIEKTS